MMDERKIDAAISRSYDSKMKVICYFALTSIALVGLAHWFWPDMDLYVNVAPVYIAVLAVGISLNRINKDLEAEIMKALRPGEEYKLGIAIYTGGGKTITFRRKAVLVGKAKTKGK